MLSATSLRSVHPGLSARLAFFLAMWSMAFRIVWRGPALASPVRARARESPPRRAHPATQPDACVFRDGPLCCAAGSVCAFPA